MDVKVNEVPVSIPTRVFTWGEFLEWLETDYLESGHCITKVLLDGREEINYRDARLCTQNLGAVNSVDVESREFDNVVRESFSELDQELEEVLALASLTARTFDARDELRGYPQLNQLLSTTQVLSTIMCEDLGWTDSPDTKVPMRDLPSRLAGALDQLATAKECRFVLAISDVIEYELIPILKSWKAIVDATRDRVQ